MNHNGIYDIFTLMNRSFVPKGIFLSRRRNLCRRPGKCDTLGKHLSIIIVNSFTNTSSVDYNSIFVLFSIAHFK